MENEWASSLKDKSAAVVGCGSGGSAVADELARMGIGKLTLVDPDVLTEENLKRHVLDASSVGKPKVLGIQEKYPSCDITAFWKKFDGFYVKPDVIASCV